MMISSPGYPFRAAVALPSQLAAVAGAVAGVGDPGPAPQVALAHDFVRLEASPLDPRAPAAPRWLDDQITRPMLDRLGFVPGHRAPPVQRYGKSRSTSASSLSSTKSARSWPPIRAAFTTARV